MTHQQADPIQILILEDSDDDKELIQLELQKEGLHSVLTRVESEQEFRRALQVKEWDLVLSDYSLPAFDGLSALNILRRWSWTHRSYSFQEKLEKVLPCRR